MERHTGRLGYQQSFKRKYNARKIDLKYRVLSCDLCIPDDDFGEDIWTLTADPLVSSQTDETRGFYSIRRASENDVHIHDTCITFCEDGSVKSFNAFGMDARTFANLDFSVRDRYVSLFRMIAADADNLWKFLFAEQKSMSAQIKDENIQKIFLTVGRFSGLSISIKRKKNGDLEFHVLGQIQDPRFNMQLRMQPICNVMYANYADLAIHAASDLAEADRCTNHIPKIYRRYDVEKALRFLKPEFFYSRE